jgi:hypothetical protein
MEKIKFITEDTDLKKVLHPLSWDIRIGDEENAEDYKAFFVYEEDQETGECIYYNHTIGGHNDYTWCCPRDEEPSFENLVAFDGWPCRWDFAVHERNYWRNKWDEISMERSCSVDIMRNGEVFNTICCRDAFYGIAKAQVLIEEYKEHPLPLNEYDYKNKVVGRKIRYNGVPGEIVRFCDGSASVVIRPLPGADRDKFFSNPHKTEDEYIEDFYEEAKQFNEMHVDIMSKHIWWFEG